MITSLPNRVRALLDRSEGFDVDFKANGKVETEDIVAFANSSEGGTILLGVEEEIVGGMQRGRVVGCRVDDEAKISIVNKANTCIPPVPVLVDVVHDEDLAFFVVSIPSGDEKPYCTAGGTYKIRGDGRNLPLLPTNILNMLIERENRRFLMRFKEVTSTLEEAVLVTRSRLLEAGNEAIESVRYLQTAVEERLDHLVSLADDADSNAADANDAAEQSLMELRELKIDATEILAALDSLQRTLPCRHVTGTEFREVLTYQLNNTDKRLMAIMNHLGLEDPAAAEIQK